MQTRILLLNSGKPMARARRIGFLLWALLIVHTLAAVAAGPGQIRFSVKSRSTGFAIPEASIEVTSSNGFKQVLLPGQAGKVTFDAPSGEYSFKIKAPGYQSLETHFLLQENAPITANIELDPLEEQASSSSPSGRKQEGTSSAFIILTGFVRNEATGTPLSGVTVESGSYTATTGEDGYFSVSIPTPAASLAAADNPSIEPAKASILFRKSRFRDYEIKNFYLIPDTYRINIALSPASASGRETGRVEEQVHGLYSAHTTVNEDNTIGQQAKKGAAGRETAENGITVPAAIRVGLNCSCNTCTEVTVMSLESYVQSGLNDEWIASWNANSLRAGAIAYRTYGAYHVNRPINPNFDISSTTCRQVWDADLSQNAKDAAIFTEGVVLTKNNAIAFSEYSAENNNSGCGDGYSGTSNTWPCIEDLLCVGTTKFGHGRGMCQWGSQRWASQAGKSHLWILDHYYAPGGIAVATGDPGDTLAPATTIEAVGGPRQTGDFTANFTDTDNIGVTGRFYQVLEKHENDWRANRDNGFCYDSFGTGTLRPEYRSTTGSWSVTPDGRLQQTDIAHTNTALSLPVAQQSGNAYLYQFAAKVTTASGPQKFGLHIMADDASLGERGNSYLIWFIGGSEQRLIIYKTIANTLNTMASVPVTITTNSWADYKITYNPADGQLSVYQNGKLKVSWKDAAPLTGGAYLSLRTNQTGVEFDELNVYKSREGSQLITAGPETTKDARIASPDGRTPSCKITSIVKDEAGNWSAVANLDVVLTFPTTITAEIKILLIYPNPVRGETMTLQFHLIATAQTTITVYDLRGNLVATLLNEVRQSGNHHMQIDCRQYNIKRGFYIVRMKSPGKTVFFPFIKE